MSCDETNKLGSNRTEDNESGIDRDELAIAEQALEFSLIGKVTVADNPKLASTPERLARFGKHLRGHGIADGEVFVKRRIVEHSVDAALREGSAIGHFEHPVSHEVSSRSFGAEVCSECRLSGGNSPVRFIDERDLSVRVIERDSDSQGTVPTAQINDPQGFGGWSQMVEQETRAVIQAGGGENPRVACHYVVPDVISLWPRINRAFKSTIGVAEDESSLFLGKR